MSILLWVLIWELIYSRAHGKHCCVGGILKWCMYGLCPPWSCVLVMWGRKAEIQWNGQRWRKMWVQRWGRYVHSSPLKRRLCRIWPWKDGARTFDLMDAILRNSGGRKKKKYSRCQVNRLMRNRAGKGIQTRTLKNLMFNLKSLVF